ncbi:uncharacterized protein F4807DRAFT_436267 [Annulohypoxylon truncatum]|uniref:uncharacterized protein n=1 Tax=Annulohypoxylon truncatum TaxID=327061 RepID=UPI00200770E9|nr:uncharacterized protein F4807DRAFT_436267 [Annulohypoxylon truncatum]KAI1207232.1 hypothetical protein F4807DRAFT_436267 [Annulohypoxylon truncatum]
MNWSSFSTEVLLMVLRMVLSMEKAGHCLFHRMQRIAGRPREKTFRASTRHIRFRYDCLRIEREAGQAYLVAGCA